MTHPLEPDANWNHLLDLHLELHEIASHCVSRVMLNSYVDNGLHEQLLEKLEECISANRSMEKHGQT